MLCISFVLVLLFPIPFRPFPSSSSSSEPTTYPVLLHPHTPKSAASLKLCKNLFFPRKRSGNKALPFFPFFPSPLYTVIAYKTLFFYPFPPLTHAHLLLESREERTEEEKEKEEGLRGRGWLGVLFAPTDGGRKRRSRRRRRVWQKKLAKKLRG